MKWFDFCIIFTIYRKMEKLIYSLFFIVFAISMSLYSQTNDVTDDIGNAFRSGDAATLAKHFGKSIELVLLNKDEVLSKEQAQTIIDRFFKKNKPSGFIFKHKGGPEDARFVVGNLVTVTGNYRIYFLLKKQNDKSLIHLLRIEKEE